MLPWEACCSKWAHSLEQRIFMLSRISVFIFWPESFPKSVFFKGRLTYHTQQHHLENLLEIPISVPTQASKFGDSGPLAGAESKILLFFFPASPGILSE